MITPMIKSMFSGMIAGSGGSGGGGSTSAVSLMLFEGANNSTDFIDENSDNTWSVIRGTPIISTEKFKFGSSSLKTSDGCIQVDLPQLPGDFTIEAWVYATASANTVIFVSDGVGGSSFMGSNGYKLKNLVAGGASRSHQNVFTTATWTHIAYVSKGGLLTMFSNGIKATATSHASTLWNNETTLSFGLGGDQNNSFRQWIGYIDSMRVSDSALYNGDFAPPTEPFS